MPFSAINTDGYLKKVDWFIEHRLQEGECAVCNEMMKIRADHTPGTSSHFYHKDKSLCPTVKKNRVRYQDLGASEYDDAQAEVLRDEVRRNLYEICVTFQSLTEGGRIHEFKDALKEADDLNIWRYKGLTLPVVPYILVTFVDFFLSSGSIFRNRDFFFILPPAVRTMDQLWNQTAGFKPKIIKLDKGFELITEYSIPSSIIPILPPEWFGRSMSFFDNKA